MCTGVRGWSRSPAELILLWPFPWQLKRLTLETIVMKQEEKPSKILYFSLQDQAIFQIWCKSSLDTNGTQLKRTLSNSEHWNKPHPLGCPPICGYSRGPELNSDSIGVSQFADSLLWVLQQCVSSRLTALRLQNWEVGSRLREASLSCRSEFHDRRSRSPGTGIQSIAGSSVMIHGVLSSTLDMCKPLRMGFLVGFGTKLNLQNRESPDHQWHLRTFWSASEFEALKLSHTKKPSSPPLWKKFKTRRVKDNWPTKQWLGKKT